MTPFLRSRHQRVEAPRHVDVAEHLEVPGLAPARLVDLRDVAARDRAGIVDQDVDVGALGGKLVDIAAVAEVERIDSAPRHCARRRSWPAPLRDRLRCATPARHRSLPRPAPRRRPARSPSTRRSPAPCVRAIRVPLFPPLNGPLFRGESADLAGIGERIEALDRAAQFAGAAAPRTGSTSASNLPRGAGPAPRCRRRDAGVVAARQHAFRRRSATSARRRLAASRPGNRNRSCSRSAMRPGRVAVAAL